MDQNQFLGRLHAVAKPRNYLEIGVAAGKSLGLSRVPSIAVDPAYKITMPVHCDLQLVPETSDKFFKRRDPIRHLRSGRNPIRNMRRGRAAFDRYLGGTVLDFAFIDGLHLFEFALRDFMNVERFSSWTSLIVIDDVMPRNAEEGARERTTTAWTGDVYKLTAALRRHRPDLILLPMNTRLTGVLVVLGADPSNTTLRDQYDVLLAEGVTPDPQDVPTSVLERHDAIDPERFFASPIIETLVKGRRRRRDQREKLRELAATLRG
jgi:hypothetical protein